MRFNHTASVAALVTGLYVVALLWVDTQNQVFAVLPRVIGVLPLLLAASVLSYAVRYARWSWLLGRAGYRPPLRDGFLAYLAGFAFTATPGKVGELIRIRYLQSLDVPPERVLAAFLFERAFDLIAVVILAGLAIQDPHLYLLLASFVGGILASLALIARYPAALGTINQWLARRSWHQLARLGQTIRTGATGCVDWINPADMVLSLALALLAWGITAASFSRLVVELGYDLPWNAALSLYPTAMLAGAASMLPAGIGTTEATLVLLLSSHGVPVGIATASAVAIRLATLWFAILCGFVSIGMLERQRRRLREPR